MRTWIGVSATQGRCPRQGAGGLPPHRTPPGIPKGEAVETLVVDNLVRFLLGPPEESEEHAEVPRRLFAYFPAHEKVCPRSRRAAGVFLVTAPGSKRQAFGITRYRYCRPHPKHSNHRRRRYHNCPLSTAHCPFLASPLLPRFFDSVSLRSVGMTQKSAVTEYSPWGR